uniref:PAC2 family protein n=1 Tax=uncultured Arthrobacter sp. TaxID=114050 RepID=UPI0025F022A6
MLDARTLFSLSADARPEQLRGLPLLASLSGFADAGQVVSQVSEELLETLDSELVAVFDTDQLIDYRNRRPRITFEEDHFTDYQAPRLEL